MDRLHTRIHRTAESNIPEVRRYITIPELCKHIPVTRDTLIKIAKERGILLRVGARFIIDKENVPQLIDEVKEEVY